MRSIAVFIVLITSFAAFAQPSNDFCSGAFSVVPNGTCYGPGLPQTTTALAGDEWIGTVGCQSGNNNEVWFTFVATGTNLNISLTNGTMGGNIEFILVEATGPCAGLTLEGSLCGASPLTGLVSNSLTPGSTYYYTISSSGANGTFTTCVTNTTPPPSPGVDCPTAAPICDDNSFSQGTFSGVGVVENIALNSCFGANERQSKWYTFTCGVSGTFEFMLSPNTISNDYDFALWNSTAGCYSSGVTMGVPLACNWNGCAGTTGIANNPVTSFGSTGGLGAGQWQNDNPPGPGTCAPGPFQWSPTVNLVAGQTYSMLIDNFTATSGGFDIDFGGTAVMGQPATFATSLDATCMIVTVNRTPFYTGANSTYLWNFGDGFTSTSGVPGAHTYLTTGTYTISLVVTDDVGCVKTFSQVVNIGCLPLPVELIALTGWHQDRTNYITWETASELNNDYFILEKSRDGINWTEFSKINGAGTTTNKVAYAQDDSNPFEHITYYRLSQTDTDGSRDQFDAISIRSNDALPYMYYSENPDDEFLYISRTHYFEVYTNMGQKIMSGTSDRIDRSKLAQGIYFLRLGNATVSFIVP